MPGEFHKSNECIVTSELYWMLLVEFLRISSYCAFLSEFNKSTYLVVYLAVVCELSHLLLIVVTFNC